MPKIKNIYQDKKTKKWFFRAYLGIDENGRKVQKTKRGYASQKMPKLLMTSTWKHMILTRQFLINCVLPIK
ncbi:hypothetical protein EfmAA290_06670 [Enterococcus faecium]|nr:hypothetical protein EfmAA290_06670 [Enterococcus faecium]